MMGDDEVSPDGRWAIRWRTAKDFSAYFESDTSYEIRVVELATQQTLTEFGRSEYANAQGSENRGVRSVHFAPDSSAVIATYEDGRTETITLPNPDAAKKAAVLRANSLSLVKALETLTSNITVAIGACPHLDEAARRARGMNIWRLYFDLATAEDVLSRQPHGNASARRMLAEAAERFAAVAREVRDLGETGPPLEQKLSAAFHACHAALTAQLDGG